MYAHFILINETETKCIYEMYVIILIMLLTPRTIVLFLCFGAL